MAEQRSNLFDVSKGIPDEELTPVKPTWDVDDELIPVDELDDEGNPLPPELLPQKPEHLLEDLSPEEYGEVPDEWSTGLYGTGSRQKVTDDVFRKLETGEKLNVNDFLKAEMALADAKKEAGIEDKTVPKGPFGLLYRYQIWKEERPRHRVKKKTYILLCIFLGWIGGHRWYEKRYYLAAFYTAMFWSAFPLFMCLTDLLIAIPKKPDEEGYIMI